MCVCGRGLYAERALLYTGTCIHKINNYQRRGGGGEGERGLYVERDIASGINSHKLNKMLVSRDK